MSDPHRTTITERQGVTSTTVIKPLVQQGGIRTPCLRYVSGIDAGKLIPLDLSERVLVIGRGEDAEVRIDSPEISRHHARLEAGKGRDLFLRDLESKNGTFVNDAPIDCVRVSADDKIRIGPYVVFKLTYQDAEEIRCAHQLYERAVRDPLTGLLDREFFRSTLEREWSYACRHEQPISLALLDLDHFKAINDTYGHQVGDGVLRGFVERMAENSRLEDLPARYGGEEFIVLLRNTGREGALIVAERIRTATAVSPIDVNGQPIELTVSIGVATFSANRMRTSKPDELVAEADEHLYEAKGSGRDRVVGPKPAIATGH